MINDASFAHLHIHTNYSLTDGASFPTTLAGRAAELGMKHIALTDHDALYAAVEWDQAAKQYGIHPIFGAELTLEDNTHLTLLVENDQGWRNLCSLITIAQHNAPKGQAALPLSVMPDHTAGLIALSGCKQGAIPKAILSKDWRETADIAQQYMEWFGRDHFFIELQNHRLREDDKLVYKLVRLADQLNLPYVATNNVHYAMREDSLLQDVLVCIRHRVTLANSRSVRRPNSEYFLKSAQEMQALFSAYPDALRNTLRIGERCTFALKYGMQDLPEYAVPDGMSADEYLASLTQQALARRLPDAPSQAHDQLAYELSVIQQKNLANYFLIVYGIVCYAQEHDIPYQGRGSGGNSLTAYLLGISPVNPLTNDLVFERFLSPEGTNTPDFDMDFPAEDRDRIFDYLLDTYGHAHAARVCNITTFQERLARLEVGNVLGVPIEMIKKRTQLLPLQERTSIPAGQHYEQLVQRLIGFPRHLSMHASGIVLFREPIAQCVPTEPTRMGKYYVVHWSKDSLKRVGFVKVDALVLRVLSAIKRTKQTVAETRGTKLDLEGLKPTDPAVYKRIAEGDTVGMFQLESPAQSQLLPRFRPANMLGIQQTISMIRPGPIQAGTANKIVARYSGLEAVTYPHPMLEPILAVTSGVMLWQEQVLLTAKTMGQFTPGQAELLRRAFGKSGSNVIEKFREAFMAGALQQGVSQETASEVFEQLRAFGGYAFARSHAAAFAIIVYQSAYLKHYYTSEYVCAILNEQPMGYWSPAVVVNDARRHGVTVLPVSVFQSQADCTMEGPNIRLGLRYVAYLGEQQIQELVAARDERTFADLPDFLRRVTMPRTSIENLIMVGAMDEWGIPRRQLLWELGERYTHPGELPLNFFTHTVDLPPLSRQEILHAEYALLGLSPGNHVMSLYQEAMQAQGILGRKGFAAARHGAKVRIAGQMVSHQAPGTANGYHFLELEDVDGRMSVIVALEIAEKYQLILRTEPLLIVAGTVQWKEGVESLRANSIYPIHEVISV